MVPPLLAIQMALMDLRAVPGLPGKQALAELDEAFRAAAVTRSPGYG